jgi:hypothetical protein
MISLVVTFGWTWLASLVSYPQSTDHQDNKWTNSTVVHIGAHTMGDPREDHKNCHRRVPKLHCPPGLAMPRQRHWTFLKRNPNHRKKTWWNNDLLYFVALWQIFVEGRNGSKGIVGLRFLRGFGVNLLVRDVIFSQKLSIVERNQLFWTDQRMK